ncbi:unnamed protein product [Arabis nemorensis]|uniref:Uncharacterized protein n=1 Tax=Arabis nemorensis TaxID=586526 RepID=A0A565BR90_9BRAS|nr:unnamed protein product [Arabis nemorensis]
MGSLPAPWIASLKPPSTPKKEVSTRFDRLRVVIFPVPVRSPLPLAKMSFPMVASSKPKPLAPSPRCSPCPDLGRSSVLIERPPDPPVPPDPPDLLPLVIQFTSPRPTGSSLPRKRFFPLLRLTPFGHLGKV